MAQTYCNPILPVDFPDPHVVRGPDGRLHAYATQGFNGPGGSKLHIQHSVSTDGVRWSAPDDAMPALPTWAYGAETWAPFVMAWQDQWLMYYCVDPDTSHPEAVPPPGKQAALVIAVSAANRPEGPFDQHAPPLVWSNQCPITWSCIDPAVDEHGYLWYGFGTIRRVRLTEDRRAVAPGSPVEVVLHPSGQPYGEIFEAAQPLERHGRRLLLVSGDRCCGPQARYGITVAIDAGDPRLPDYRLLSEVAPHRDSLLLRGNGLLRDPGHHWIITDDAGQDWVYYHAKLGVSEDRVLCLDQLLYDADGLPFIVSGSPSVTVQQGPVFHPRGERESTTTTAYARNNGAGHHNRGPGDLGHRGW